jgi:hypothetical protein
MCPQFFDYDADFGIKTETAWDDIEQKITVYREADVSPFLDHAHNNRQELGLNRQGIRENWWQYATIPPIVQIQLRAKGLEVGNPDHEKRIIEEINTNYPFLKMTTGNMGGKVKQYYT